jgi:hypothetical protein
VPTTECECKTDQCNTAAPVVTVTSLVGLTAAAALAAAVAVVRAIWFTFVLFTASSIYIYKYCNIYHFSAKCIILLRQNETETEQQKTKLVIMITIIICTRSKMNVLLHTNQQPVWISILPSLTLVWEQKIF